MGEWIAASLGTPFVNGRFCERGYWVSDDGRSVGRAGEWTGTQQTGDLWVRRF